MSQIALQVTGLSKTFGQSKVLKDVSLSLQKGEVHGLLGQNGSGKSTFIKILCGYHAPDPGGSACLFENSLPLPVDTSAIAELGIRFVQQDLGVFESLSVIENFFAPQFLHGTIGAIPWPTLRAVCRDILTAYGVRAPLSAIVSEIPPSERALLAIARAAEIVERGKNGSLTHRLLEGILVLDEPTVFLPAAERDRLRSIVWRVRGAGCSVLFVSHDLEEVLTICDRVTILRDGEVVTGGLATDGLDKGRLIKLIVGKESGTRVTRPVAKAKPVVARAEGVVGKNLRHADVALAAGEITGLTGLAGSGYEEIVYLLFGAERAAGGTLRMRGRSYNLGSMRPTVALSLGMALIPANKLDAGFQSMTVADNLMIRVLNRYWRNGRIRWKQLRSDGERVVETFDIRPRNVLYPFDLLSGGNQQKVILAKWLQAEPELLLLDEPTQGVDVGARASVHEMLRRSALEGQSVVVASLDHDELVELCDRVLVFRNGTVRCELEGEGLSKRTLLEAATS